MMDRIFISISKTLSNTDTTKTSSSNFKKRQPLSLPLSLSRHILCVQKQTTQMNTKGSVFFTHKSQDFSSKSQDTISIQKNDLKLKTNLCIQCSRLKSNLRKRCSKHDSNLCA